MKKRTIILICLLLVVFIFSMTLGRTFFYNVLTGRVSMPDRYINSEITMPNGERFKVLRRVKVSSSNEDESDPTVFIVRFKFNSLSLDANKRLSMIPAPFLIGMEGFREKYWTFNEESSTFQGLYQWSSEEAAKAYPDSFIYNLMVKRSAPGTLSYEIKRDIKLADLIATLKNQH